MASFIYYRFKSQKDESKISFDGTGISVFDLKKEIVLSNNLKANDFDLLLFDPHNEQGKSRLFRVVNPSSQTARASFFVEYKDDTHIIPRSSSVIAKRVPAKPGKGRGALYLTATTPNGVQSDTSAGKDKSQSSSLMRARVGSGAVTVRFDGKEDHPDAKPSVRSMLFPVNQCIHTTPTPKAPSLSAPSTESDEAAAMAAMFKAQTDVWEETQEKMSQ